jgi:hypothetical protein
MLCDIPMSYLKASLVVQLVLALYFQAIVWFPLGAWNDQPGKRLIEVVQSGEAPLAAFGFGLVMLLPISLFALAYWRRWFWLMWLGLFGYGFGADQRALHNQKFLERTTKILPSFPNHPAPDAMHFVLDVLLLSVVALTSVGLFKLRRKIIVQA